MRLKHTYNFLGGGVPFCYRGIFSGLSNETVGTALYFHPGYHYYFPLLCRYARSLTRDWRFAIRFAVSALKEQYELDRLADAPGLRKLLKVDVYNRCVYFNQSKILDRSPLKLPLA
jgi:hypothetical protein